ncbi:membrane protein involved in colicin uptake [Sphingobium indicum UT26S]|uniref:Membrane protein involved in colicin uptake n=2 Tax=Sphingomonadaceae TaxID=41297 RepID=D4YZQ0_SPHIU|nr:membrane protein involved in colicin uptake [Sphingobium indicum UT26S]
MIKRSGGSSRLMAHRLATYDAEQAKMAGPVFEGAWRTRHGEAGAPKFAAAINPVPVFTATSAPPKEAYIPPVILKETKADAEARAAADRKRVVIAKAAAEFEVRRKAEEERIRRESAADAVWERAYAPSLEQLGSGQAKDDVWAKAWASTDTGRRALTQSLAAAKWEVAHKPAERDEVDVWARAYAGAAIAPAHRS